MLNLHLCYNNVLLYSQTKGVKQKYMRCISGLVVYRQYIHNCSSQVDLRLAHAVSQVSAPQLPWFGSTLLAGLRYSSPLPHLGSDPQLAH